MSRALRVAIKDQAREARVTRRADHPETGDQTRDSMNTSRFRTDEGNNARGCLGVSTRYQQSGPDTTEESGGSDDTFIGRIAIRRTRLTFKRS